MAKSNQESHRDGGADGATKPAGDNRRAGDVDGNAAAGNPKSKGVKNPADEPGAQGEPSPVDDGPSE